MAIGPGSRGPEVLEHQRRLKAAGFDPGPLDGIWGPRTQQATQAHHDAVMGKPPGAPLAVGPVGPEQLSAKAVLSGALASYGLSNLGQWAWDNYIAGKPMEQIVLDIRTTPEYRQRFPAMESLSKRGRAISEAEYISLEQQYAQIAHSYGTPRGFYDTPDDFARYIEGDMSPAEFQRRLELGAEVVNNMPREVRDFARDHYGLREGDMLAFVMDPDRALPLLQKQVRTAEVAGFAERAGLRRLNLGEAEEFATLDPSEINDRINLYISASHGQPEETKRELARLYGITDLAGTVVDADVAVARVQEQVSAAMTAGLSRRTGYGALSAAEAERLAAVGVTEEAFQRITHDSPLFNALPGQGEDVVDRGEQMQVLTGNTQAIESLERKRQTRTAAFGGGGGFAQNASGVVGLQSTT